MESAARPRPMPGRSFLYVAPSYLPFVGGAQRFQHATASRLAVDGCAVTVLTSDAREPADFWRPRPDQRGATGREDLPAEMDGVCVMRLPLAYPWPAPWTFAVSRRAGHWLHQSPLPKALQLPLLRRLARSMPPLPGAESAMARLAQETDLVQATDASWDGLFCLAEVTAHRLGKPFVAVPLMHLGSPAEPSGARVRAHFQMAHQVQSYRQAEAVIALSQREADALAALGVSRERLHVLPMGIERPGPSVTAEEEASFRARRGLEGPIIAFIGANSYDKGATSLVEAMTILTERGRAAQLVCVGSQPEALRAYVNGRPMWSRRLLAERVHVLGPVAEREKECLLASCALLALPSQVETFGIVVLEAWRHGKPAIGANVGGLAELITEHETGLLVPFGDPPALADAIERLLMDQALARRLGLNGQRTVAERYTWDHTYQQLLGIYESVLSGRG